jgi:hypothetical protein
MVIPEEMFRIRDYAPNRVFNIFGRTVSITSSSEFGIITENFDFSSEKEAKDAVLIVKLAT